MSHTQWTRLVAERGGLYFDYDRQVWVKGGVYQDCGHPQTGERYRDGTEPVWTWGTWPGCSCFGRLHAGERVAS